MYDMSRRDDHVKDVVMSFDDWKSTELREIRRRLKGGHVYIVLKIIPINSLSYVYLQKPTKIIFKQNLRDKSGNFPVLIRDGFSLLIRSKTV